MVDRQSVILRQAEDYADVFTPDFGKRDHY
jgi:hypothetical protein